MARLRVLSVSKSTGGLAQYNTRLCTALDSARFEVSAVCLADNNLAYAEALRAQGIQAAAMDMDRYKINLWSDFRVLWQLYRYVRAGDYDVLIGHGTKAGFLVRLVGCLTAVPSVYRLATMSFVPRIQGRSAHVYRFLERLAARWGGHIITVASASRIELVGRGIAPAGRVSVIHTGIDLDRFSPGGITREEACHRLGLDPSRPVVGWAGRLVPQKAPLDYLRAARRIVELIPDVQIYLAGDGPLQDEVQQFIESLNLLPNIIRAAWQADVPAMLTAFDVYVLSSHWEGLPQSLLEAMAMTCPAVATAVDGTVEAIHDGIEGYLVDAGDDETMAECAIVLLKDRALREQIGRAARQRIMSEFALPKMIAEWETLLLSMAKRR